MDPPPAPPVPSPLLQPMATSVVTLPRVALDGPAGSLLLELLTYNGAPFHDHWAFFLVRSGSSGDRIHAKGDVRVGFEFQIEKGHNIRDTSDLPSKRTPLQWIEAKYLAVEGQENGDGRPGSQFEECVREVEVPTKSLVSIDEAPAPRRRVVQRDCQTWIVEAADKLVAAGIVKQEVAAYLHSIQQS